MKITGVVFVALIALGLAAPARGETYKTTYPMACSEMWPAVKEVLSNADNNYEVKKMDEAQMSAAYNVKHNIHVNITGAILQRTNKVKLVPKGDASCEMQVVSNYSGPEHNDQGDFKARVEKSLAKMKAAKPPEPTKAEEPAKPAEPAKPTNPGE